MLIKEIANFLRTEKFLNIATTDLNNRPNVAPKFLLKIDNDLIYLVDYVKNTTLKNIRINPRASISFIDINSLKGYQANGVVEVIDKGPICTKLLIEYEDKQVKFSTERLINSLHSKKSQRHFEVEFPNKAVILKIKVSEAVGIGLKGNLEREAV